MAAAVLVAYPHPPRDRPCELVAFLAILEPLRGAVTASRSLPRPPVAPTRTYASLADPGHR